MLFELCESIKIYVLQKKYFHAYNETTQTKLITFFMAFLSVIIVCHCRFSFPPPPPQKHSKTFHFVLKSTQRHFSNSRTQKGGSFPQKALSLDRENFTLTFFLFFRNLPHPIRLRLKMHLR